MDGRLPRPPPKRRCERRPEWPEDFVPRNDTVTDTPPSTDPAAGAAETNVGGAW